MSILKKFVIFLAILVVILPMGAYGYVWFKLKDMHDPNLQNDSLSNLDYKNEKGITNILLMGIDARPGETASRSDAMMILTIDSVHKSIKLTSLARDSYVDIPGHGMQKLTHAYAYGKAELLIKTIEQNFNIDLNYYATVDFESFMYIIDTVGGVKVNVKKGYIREMNKFIPETYKWNTNENKGSIKYITTSGEQILNGYQALAFSRIRHNDTAFDRDGRQREVMQSMLSSVKTLSLTKYPELVNSVLPYVKTNMKPTEIMGMAMTVLQIGDFNIKQFEFPIDDGVNSKGGIYGSAGWVLRFDDDSLKYLHDFIFSDKEYKDNL
ncbi:MAG: LCP family protein [Clostridioides sp.]|jgi:LCP family protein required for cell wall assembly|nr:LCP family protein [Clostridioides sp.]